VGRGGDFTRPSSFATIEWGNNNRRNDMDNDRIIDMGEDLRSYVFELLDQETDLTGFDAGAVAKAVEDAFVQALQKIVN